jgi:class 3 adenylate cyclase
VNVAARLEGQSLPGRIVVGETTAELLGDHFPLESMGPLQLKGVAQPVHAHMVGAEG